MKTFCFLTFKSAGCKKLQSVRIFGEANDKTPNGTNCEMTNTPVGYSNVYLHEKIAFLGVVSCNKLQIMASVFCREKQSKKRVDETVEISTFKKI